MKKFCLVLLVAVLAFSCVAVNADEIVSEETDTSAETTETLGDSGESANVVRFVLIGGSVIGALCAVTLLYKKKDEIRYL